MRTPALFALALVAAAALVPAPLHAANAKHPYRNIDRRVDKGGPTGDDQVERLNQQQLDAARAQNGSVAGAPGLGAPLMPAPAR